jgi:MYXO-CTERM domain-containing protein
MRPRIACVALALLGLSRTSHALPTVGEVVVLEGDSEIVSGTSDGDYGIGSIFGGPNQIKPILARFFAEYPDEFDGCIIWTTFADHLQPGGHAYYLPFKNEVRGIGFRALDESGAYGSASGRLHGILNMSEVAHHAMRGIEPGSTVYGVLGQEITHRWLAFMYHAEPNGLVAPDMIARQGAHWSQLVDTGASVQDGIDWTDNLDGSFTLSGTAAKDGTFSELDQYALGLRDASEVQDFFLLRDVTLPSGTKLNGPTFRHPELKDTGLVVTGTRVDVTMDQIVLANGWRTPSAGASQRDFRYAWLLVTRPGETLADALTTAEQVETMRKTFDDWFFEATDHRARVCSQVSAPCVRPELRVELTLDGEDSQQADGDGVLEAGEGFRAHARVWNAGLGAATGVSLEAGAVDARFIVEAFGQPALGDLAPAEERNVELTGRVADDAPCGQDLALKLGITSDGEASVMSYARTRIGYESRSKEAFATDAGWQVNPDGTDTATGGKWEWGFAQPTQFQPQGGSEGSSDAAWVTGPLAGSNAEAGDVDGGVTTLVSAPIDVSGIDHPVLRFKYWLTTAVVADGIYPTPSADKLSIEASSDLGATYTLLAERSGRASTFLTAELPLYDVLDASSGSVVLRFRVTDDPPETLTEALIDDVEISNATESCGLPSSGTGGAAGEAGQGGAPGGNAGVGGGSVGSGGSSVNRADAGEEAGGCGCRVGERALPPANWLAGVALLFLGVARRIRHAARLASRG